MGKKITDSKTSHYENLGVSSDKKEVHNAFAGFDQGIYPGSFCKILPDINGDPEYCTIMHADGAGTKSSLAYAHWRETGNLDALRNIPIDAIVMNIDDLLCVGSTGPYMLSQTIGRNKSLIPEEVLKAIAQGTTSFMKKMSDFGIEIIHIGGETADVGDLVRTIIIDSTVVPRMLRSNVVPTKIKAGDIIVGLASYGKATYEDEYNSGMGSNGLTSARHDVFRNDLAKKYPELYDPALPKELVYSGKYSMQDKYLGDLTEYGQATFSIAQLILSPTRTYTPIIKKFLESDSRNKSQVSAMIHCSGGGQTKCLRFASPDVRIFKDNLFDIPPVFEIIRECTKGKMSDKEMYQSYNMGHRFEVYCKNEQTAEKLINISRSFGVDAKIIGKCIQGREGEGVSLRIISCLGNFDYTL